MHRCVRNSGWVGIALAFSISGMVREEPGANGWLWNLERAYTCSLDNSHTQQRVNFPGTIGSEIAVEILPVVSYKSKTADNDI